MNGILEVMTALNCAVLESIPVRFLDCPAERLANCCPGHASSIFQAGSHALYSFPCCCMETRTPALRRRRRYCGVICRVSFIGPCSCLSAMSRRQRQTCVPCLLRRTTIGSGRARRRLILPRRTSHDGSSTMPLPGGHFAHDIHNNTGLNPHYACITRPEPQFIALARLFSRTVVHFERPLGVHAGAFGRLCPAITVECGKAGGDTGAAHAVELIEACLSMAQLPPHDVVPHDVDLFRTYAIVKVPVHASFPSMGLQPISAFDPTSIS